jgi:Transglycosylase SLT domain
MIRMNKFLLIFIVIAVSYFLIGCQTVQEPSVPPNVTLPKLDWNNENWTYHLVNEINKSKLPDLNPKDVDAYCPKYNELNRNKKRDMWAVLAVAIAKRESNFKPTTVFKESNGIDSIGLYQLSYGDRFCPKNKSIGDLQDPLINISCAVKTMEFHVANDGIIASGGYVSYGAPPAKGLARYWSVIRVPDRKSNHFLKEIKTKTNAASGCQ